MGAALGPSSSQLNTEDSWLLAMGLDESGSMGMLQTALIDEMNIQSHAIANSDAGDSMLMSLYTFNETLRRRYAFKAMADVPILTPADYIPGGGTALVDALDKIITEAVDYRSYLLKAGQTSVRVIVTLLTDGQENQSRIARSTVASKVAALIKTEMWSFNLIGLGDPRDFNKVAQELNIPSVLTVGKNEHDLRLALGLHSKGAQNAHSSQTSPQANYFTQLP